MDNVYLLRTKLSQDDIKLIADIVWNQKLTDNEVGRFSMEISSVDYSLDDDELKKYVENNKRFGKISLALYLYVINRHIFLKNGISSRDICDYISNMLYEFAIHHRYMKISKLDDENYHYLSDILSAMRESKDHRQILLSTHLGNYSLWRCGLFGNVDEKYYIAMGKMGYKISAINPQSGMYSNIYYELSDNFELILKSLKEFSKSNNFMGDAGCH